MKRLSLFSEPFPRTGGMAAEGYRRLLGRPTLDLLQTVLREAIQNVVDASVAPSGARVIIRLRTLSVEQSRVLRAQVFRGLPVDDPTEGSLAEVLGHQRIRVLELCDFGTIGLSGSTRADRTADGGEPQNFVNFLRNVGAPRDTQQGGGTYGYGKSALYAMSSCSTILVDSQTLVNGEPVRRLMGCHLGAAFNDGRIRYTGRHWWGRLERGAIEPCTGDDAMELAEHLGLPPRGPRSSGTSIVIVDPLIDATPEDVTAEIIETVLWNFWPRMTESTPRHRRLEAIVELEGKRLPVPRPESFPPLDLFAAAMAQHRSASEALQPILSLRPKKTLGQVALQPGARAQRHPVALRAGTAIPDRCAHIALMRPAELVVRYLPGEPFVDPSFEWAGVFICSSDSEVEEAFAMAEPPAHDDWIPDNLPKGPAKTFVNVALRELTVHANSFAAPAAGIHSGSADSVSLAAVAERMGMLLDMQGPTKDMQGPIRERSPRQRSAGGSRPRSTASSPSFRRLELDSHGNPVAVFDAELQNDGKDDQLSVTASPHLVLDGSAVDVGDLDDGFSVTPVGMSLAGPVSCNAVGGRLRVGTASGKLEIVVSTVPEAAVGVRLVLEGGTS